MDERTNQDRELEHLKLYFEGNKHLTTLAVAVIILVTALDVDTGLGLVLFGGSLLLSLMGMQSAIAILGSGHSLGARYGAEIAAYGFMLSSSLFIIGVLLFILWPGIRPG